MGASKSSASLLETEYQYVLDHGNLADKFQKGLVDPKRPVGAATVPNDHPQVDSPHDLTVMSPFASEIGSRVSSDSQRPDQRGVNLT